MKAVSDVKLNILPKQTLYFFMNFSAIIFFRLQSDSRLHTDSGVTPDSSFDSGVTPDSSSGVTPELKAINIDE